MRVAVDGDLALASGSGNDAPQDVGAAFGLGSERDSPYVRVVAEGEWIDLSASGFWLRESGAGVLGAAFGGLPAATPVSAELELGNFKMAAVVPLRCGPLTIAPGCLLDVFAIDFRVSESPGNREEVDDVVAVPMPFVRVSAPFLGLRATAEIGYLDAPRFTGVDARFADIEAMLAWQPGQQLQLFAGYRVLVADANGASSTDSVAIDLQVSGWFLGGGLRF